MADSVPMEEVKENDTKMDIDTENLSATEETSEEQIEEIPLEPLSVDILPTIKDAQQHHGLRHGDYQRYRQYCARRLKRIRNSLHFKLGNRHGYKGKAITQETVTDSRFLAILLMEAERCWSYAMELKLYANTEPRKKFHMVRKLVKAAKYADELNKLSELERVDARTKLEAQAYCYWMTANLKFEIQDWQTAVDLYTQARTIYEKLSTAFVDESIKSLYLQKVDEIGPNIRYCGYNLGQGGIDINELMKMRSSAAGQDLLAAKIDDAIKQTREKLASSFGEVTWRDKTVPIKTEKARMLILQVQDKDTEIERHRDFDSKMEFYDNLLMECRDVLFILKDDIAAENNSKKKSEMNIANLQFIRTYLQFSRQMLLTDRNLLMIESMKEKLPILIGQDKQQNKGKTTKPEDMIRLFDSVIQCLTEASQLPGLQEDETMKAEIEAQVTAYKAFRCFYIAQSYQQGKKWIEAVALYDRVISYIDSAVAGLKKCSSPALNVLVTKVEDLSGQAKGHKYSAHASCILETTEVDEGMAKLSVGDKVLAERLDTYYEHKSIPKKVNLVNFPPDLQPVPCKPVFFDLALNHVELPNLENRMEKKKETGISSMVKGWLWGSS